MSFNGSGTFVINSSGQPVVTGTTISSTVFNALTADLATGLTNTICKDGQSTTTATIPFATAVTMASTLSVTGHVTLEGVTSAGATGTGNLVFSASPTLTGTLTAAAANFSGAITGATTLVITGNVGFGATPGSYDANYRVLEMEGGGTVFSRTGSVPQSYLNSNVLGGGANPKYANSNSAAQIIVDGFARGITFNTAASGTAGNAITFRTDMSIGSTGAVFINSLTASRGVLTDASKNLISADAPVTNSLAADVNLNNTGTYFDGPSCANGTTGTWFASGTVTLTDTAGAGNINIKLWDGSTVIASANVYIPSASAFVCASLSGYITTPAGNLRISCKDVTSTSGKIIFNQSGNSKDSTISAVRVA